MTTSVLSLGCPLVLRLRSAEQKFAKKFRRLFFLVIELVETLTAKRKVSPYKMNSIFKITFKTLRL